MLALLLKKEWRENFRFKLVSGKKNLFSKAMSVLILAMLLATFILIFALLNQRFSSFGVSQPLYIISLFLVGMFQMIVHMPRLKKMVFNPDDKQIIDCLPIKKRTLILSKIIVFYVEELVSLFFLFFPLTIAYGYINELESSFYLVLVPLVFVSPIVVLTISLVLVYPYYYITEKIKNKYLIQLILIVLIIGGFAFLYKDILDIFIALVNKDRLAYLFNEENALVLKKISNYMYPYNMMIDLYNGEPENGIFIILILFGCLALCFLLSDRLYFSSFNFNENKIKEKNNSVTSSTVALIKKEYILMFRSTNYLFSYGSLLVLLPVFVTIVSISFKALITRLLGELFFVSFVILFVTMFSAVINSFGGLFISREKNSISIIKMLPVSFKRQMYIKVGISMFNAMVSILFTVIALLIFGLINFVSALGIFVISVLLVGVLLISLAKKDLNKPAYKDEENNLTSAIVYSLIIPVVLFIGSLFLSMLLGTNKMFLILIAVMLIMLIALFVSYNSTVDKNFGKLRVE